MPDRCRDANQVDNEYRHHAKLTRYDIESLVRMGGHRDTVQSRDHSKPEIQDVKRNKEEQDDSGYPLHEIEPVARVRVSQVVGARFSGNHQAVDGVIDEGYKDAANFHEDNVGDRLQVLYSVIEIRGP